MKFLDQRKIIGLAAKENGITLVEVIIATSLTVLLMTAAFGVLDSSIKGYNIQTEQADSQAEAQKAITQLERELRQAERPLLYVSSDPGTYELIVYKADLNDDGTSEAIMYEYSSLTKTIHRKINTSGDYNFSASPEGVLAQNVVNTSSAPVFEYYNDATGWLNPNDASTNVIDNVRVVRVRLNIDKDLSKAPNMIDLMSNIKLRNFHY